MILIFILVLLINNKTTRMLTSVKGIYENGIIRPLENVGIEGTSEVIITFLSTKKINKKDALKSQLAAMAADPQVQSEIKKINHEFAAAEIDGLDEL